MKDIKAIIEEHAADLTDDVKAAIFKDVRANYKTVAEYAKKVDRIEELENHVAAVGEKASKLEGDSKELEELRAEIKARDEAEAERAAEAKKAADLEKFRAVFNETLGDREFVNEIMAETVFQRVYDACSAEPGKSANAALDDTIKDMDGVWKNPQRDPKMMPSLEQVSSAKQTDETAARKSLASMLFGGSSAQ